MLNKAIAGIKDVELVFGPICTAAEERIAVYAQMGFANPIFGFDLPRAHRRDLCIGFQCTLRLHALLNLANGGQLENVLARVRCKSAKLSRRALVVEAAACSSLKKMELD